MFLIGFYRHLCINNIEETIEQSLYQPSVHKEEILKLVVYNYRGKKNVFSKK